MTAYSQDTIVALASAPGKGGVGVVRVSGPLSEKIAFAITGKQLKPRYASFSTFLDKDNNLLDSGIALFFPGPHSFTGEDVLELQGHGGPVIVDLLIKRTLELGARLARPGEFSERAFLNDKLDLTQAEAIADLIDSSSEQAARNAVRTLQGAFSDRIHELQNSLTKLRLFIEAAIDFPEEEIDFIAESQVTEDLQALLQQLQQTLKQAQQGATLQEGMRVVLAGLPNAGKSSLLNALSGRETAIVTDIAGTTRDVLKEQIILDGLPLHIIDTAGLRDSTDLVEQEGIRRAWHEIEQADRILLVVDYSQEQRIEPELLWPAFGNRPEAIEKITIVQNKVDLTTDKPGLYSPDAAMKRPCHLIRLSAKQGMGIEILSQHLRDCVGYQGVTEGSFSARRRHIQALENTAEAICNGLQQLQEQSAPELLAEELRLAQQHLSEITGELTSDDLLGKIFSSFCIGK